MTTHNDYSGQEQRDGANDTPASEAAETREVPINSSTSSQNGSKFGTEVIQSDDDRLHLSRNSH